MGFRKASVRLADEAWLVALHSVEESCFVLGDALSAGRRLKMSPWSNLSPGVKHYRILLVEQLACSQCRWIKVLSYLQIFGHCKEGAQLCLGDVHLPVVHEVEHGQDAFILDAPQVEQGVVMRVSLQHPSKER